MRESKYEKIVKESSKDKVEINAKRQSAVLTAVITGLLFLVLFFYFIPPNDPPFVSSPDGMDIILGSDATGSGSMDVTGGGPMAAAAKTQPAPPQPAPEASPVENDPEAPEITKTKPVKPTVTPVVKPVSKPVTTPAVKPTPAPVSPAPKPTPAPVPPKPAPPARVANPNALFSNKGGKGNVPGATGQGDDPGKNGNKGNPNGDPNGGFHGGHGNNPYGNGTGSNGTGTGPGSGNGNGFGWDLKGRDKVSIPIPQDNSQLSGKVVVEIGVDRDGNVVQARGGVKGSTTLDQTLITKAENAARKAKFTKNPDAADIQQGHITYNFGLN